MYFRSKLLKTTKVLMLILISVCLYNLGFAKQYGCGSFTTTFVNSLRQFLSCFMLVKFPYLITFR
jgi:ABC-type uncharacterized transport system permease subunit